MTEEEVQPVEFVREVDFVGAVALPAVSVLSKMSSFVRDVDLSEVLSRTRRLNGRLERNCLSSAR